MFPAIIKKASKKKFLSKKNLVKTVSVFLFVATVGVSVYFYNNLFNSEKNDASASTISSSFFSTANLELSKDGDAPFSANPSVAGDPSQDQAGVDSSPNNGVVREGDTFIYTYNMSPAVELVDVKFTDFLPANTTNIQYSSSSTLISNTICKTGSTISTSSNISKIDCIIGDMLPGQTYRIPLLARVTASIADDLVISNDFQITAKVKSSGVIVSGNSQPASFRVSSAPSYTKFYRLGNLEPLKDASLITEGIKVDAGIALNRSNIVGLRENLKNFSVDLTYSLANSANTITYPSTIKLINWTDDATNPTKYGCKDTNGARTTCQEVARTANSVTIRLSFEAINPAVGIGTNFDANIFIWLPVSEVSNSTGCKYTCKLQVVASNFQTPSQTPSTAGLYGLSGNLDKGATATTNSVFFSKDPTVTFAGNTSLEPSDLRVGFDHATRGRDFYFMQGFSSTGGFINNTTICSIIDNRYYTLKSPAVLHASQVTPQSTSDSIVEYGVLNTADKSYPDDASVASSLCENDSTTTWVADTNVKDTTFPALPSGYTSKNIAKVRIKYSDNNPGSWPIGANFTATTNTYLNNNTSLGLISGNNFAFSHYTLAKFTALDGTNTYTTPNNNWITVNNPITNANGFINTINRNGSTWAIKDTLYFVETEPKLAAGSTTAANYGSGLTRINLQPEIVYDFNQSITLRPGVAYDTNTKTNLQYSFSLPSLVNLKTANLDFASSDIIFKNIDNTPASYTTSCTYDKTITTDKKILCNILNIPLNNPVIVATSKLIGVKNIPIGTSVPITGRVSVIKADTTPIAYTYQRNTQTTNFQFINNLNFYTTNIASTGNSEKSQTFNFKMDFASALATNSNVEIINILPFNSDLEGSKVTASSLKLDSILLKTYPLDTALPPVDDTTNSVQIQYTKTVTSNLKLDPSDITNKPGGTTVWCDDLSGGTCPTNLSEVTAVRFKIPDMPKAGDEGSSRQVVLNMSNNANTQYGDLYKNKYQLLATTVNPITTNNLVSNIATINIVDSTAPEVPIITTIDGKLATNNPITTDNTPEIKGTSESGTTLKVSTSELTLCDNTTTPTIGNIVYTNEGKNWSCTPSLLPDATYQIVATTKDNVNLISTSTPATFTVDTVAPVKPTISTPQANQTINTSSFVATGGFVAGGLESDIVSVSVRDKASTQTLCTNSTTVNTVSLWTNCNLTNLTNGNYQIEAVATDKAGLTTISDPVNFVVNIPTEITIDELDSLNINCITKEVNSTTSCTFLIPENKLLPDGFKLSISDGVMSLACVKESDPDSRLVNCTNVATGTVAGNQIIYAQIGEGAKTPTKDRVEITPPPSVDITPTNYNDVILVSNCTQNQTINIPQTYNCEFALKNTSTLPAYPTTYSIPSQTQIKAWTSTQTGNLEPLTASDSLCVLNQAKTALVCNGIKTANATAGPKNILITISTGDVNIALAQTPADKGDVTLAASPLEETILIPQSAVTHNPDPASGLKIYGAFDYTLTINDPRLVENSKTSVCTYRIKEVTGLDADEVRSYQALTSTILSPIADGLGQYDTSDKVFRVNYDSVSGVGVKLLKDNQKFTDYNVQIRCTRSDGQQFATDQKINYKLGAYSIVTFQAAEEVQE